jgi:hypothetical protein
VYSDTFFCEGESLLLNIIDSSTNSSVTIDWSDRDSVFNKVITEKGGYSYTVSNGYCSVSNALTIEENDNPSKTIPDRFTLCMLESEFVTIDLNQNYEYTWSDIGQKNTERSLYNEGVYSFISESEHGCKTADTLEVIDFCDPIIHVPNAFVIGGVNNVFKPYLKYTDISVLDIYNRWGEKIYSSTGLSPSWDGTVNGEIQQQGVYMYTLSVSFISGTAFRKGTVSLLH